MHAPRSWEESRATHAYRDPDLKVEAMKVLPGEYYVGGRDRVLTTVLGSCVSACIRDPALGIGGMNHFMLPAGDAEGGANARYGLYAMEILVNDLMRRGAKRERLEAKVFGGGNVMAKLTTDPVGARNVAFVRQFLAQEKINVVGEDLLGDNARKVAYFPATGRALVRTVGGTDAGVTAGEEAYRKRLVAAPIAGDIELF